MAGGQPPPTPLATLCPPWSVCGRPGLPHTPLSSPPSVSPSLAPCRSWQGPRGCLQRRGGAQAFPGSHTAVRGALCPCSHTWGGLLTQAAAEAAPDGRRCSTGTLGGPPCPLQAGGQAAGLGPVGLELLASLEGSGLVVAWLLPNQGCHGQSGCLGHSTVGPTHKRQRWGPSFLGTSFSRVLATGPTWEPARETKFLRSSTQPRAAQRCELLLFTACLSRAGRHPLPDWAGVGVLATDWVLPTG